MKLRNEWYEYLKSNGFTDIERGDYLTDHKSIIDLQALKDFQTHSAYEARVSYYQWAREKLNDGSFSSERDKLIWEYHAEGLSRRQISPRVGYEHSYISRKIKGIAEYLKNQAYSVASASYSCA